MTAAARVRQLAGWHELVRLVVGRSRRDEERLEKLKAEILAALEQATREHDAMATVDAHIARELGGRT